MEKYARAVLAGSIFAFLSFTNIANADIGVSPKAGTLGAGVTLSKGFGEKFSINLDLNTYSYDTAETEDGIDYDFKFDLQSGGVLANYHPFSGAFRLTAGVMVNNNEFKLTGKPTSGTYTIGDTTYTSAQVGSLTGKLTFNSTAPYVGIGWGNRPGRHFGLTADIGALYQGSPKFSLSATGAVAGLAADIEKERAQVESDLSKYKWYPVLSIGLYFRF